MKNEKKINQILKDIENKSKKLSLTEFDNINDYGSNFEHAKELGLVSGGKVIRAGIGSEVQGMILDDANLTSEGIKFLENYVEYTDGDLQNITLEIVKDNTGVKRNITKHFISKELPVYVDKIKIDWFLNNLVDEKKIRRIKGKSFKGFDGKTQKGEDTYEFIPKNIEHERTVIMNNADKLMTEPTTNKSKDKIFIIHGHDIEMKREVQLILSRAGLDDIVLHEQPDLGRTIIDKLIEETKDSCYAIALLSPDDIGELKMRARQNVILEIGYFLGKLGKSKVRLLVKENVEIPSDLQGVLYEPFDVSGNWRMRILKEIKACGIEIDLDAVLKKL